MLRRNPMKIRLITGLMKKRYHYIKWVIIQNQIVLVKTK